jgi:hypothetical protein
VGSGIHQQFSAGNDFHEFGNGDGSGIDGHFVVAIVSPVMVELMNQAGKSA